MTINETEPSHPQIDNFQNPGHFELPTPENPNSAAPHGARHATWDPADEIHGETHEDFPMIVWLRGDEPWFQQFDLDAEAVMRTLGIKRSRLTQIAGKELRVGRVRVDRYIRPVFRDVDVKQYLAWTRATASHQKSSDAIKIAVDQLERQSDLIQKTMNDIGQQLTREIRDDLSTFISASVSDGINPIALRVSDIEATIQSRIARLDAAFTQASSQLSLSAQSTAEAIQEFARGQAAALESLTLQMNETSERTSMIEERLTAWDQMLTSHLQFIAKDVAELKKPSPFKPNRTKKTRSQSTTENHKNEKPLLQRRHAPSRRKGT
jgi:hypothetical protein